jgi:hypothetical protein
MMKYKITFEDNGEEWYEYYENLEEAQDRIHQFVNDTPEGLSLRGYMLEELEEE